MAETRTEQVAGWDLTIDADGVCTKAVGPDGRTFEVNQEVISNGRFGAPKGRAGNVYRILRPWSDGRTSNFVEVTFPGYGISHMKPKDLEL